MVRQGMTALAVLMMVASTAAAQDAKTVLGNAARALGIENVTAVHFYGTAAARQSGPEQQRQPAMANDRRQRLRACHRFHADCVAGDLGHLRGAGAAAPRHIQCHSDTQQNITRKTRRGRSSWKSR